MTTHDDFQKQMRADPDDHQSRAVYADWVRENVPTPHADHIADRLGWWARALAHLNHVDGKFAGPVGRSTADNEQAFPDWVHRLVWAHGVNYGLTQAPTEWRSGHAIRQAAHVAELHALGLQPGLTYSVDREERVPGLNRLRSPEYEVARNLLRGSVKESPFHPVRDLAELLGTHLWAHHSNNMNHLADFIRSDPPPETGGESSVHLARPLGWLKDKIGSWLKGSPPPRDKRDGIVHAHAKNPTGAFAEKSAVARALQMLGAPEHMSQVDRYTAHVARFVNENPEHRIVKEYLDRAGVIGGTAGPELTAAVKPLVGVVNLLLATHGLDERFKLPVSESKAAAFAHSAVTPESSTPVEAPIESPSEPEHNPEENQHILVKRLLQQHKNKAKVKEVLKAEHGLSHQEAHAAVQKHMELEGARRFKAFQREAKRNPDAKLAAPKPGGTVEREHLSGEVHPRGDVAGRPRAADLADTSLGFHLRKIGQQFPKMRRLTETALTEYAITGTDPFQKIGEALPEGHSLKRAYNWASMQNSLKQDRDVAALVEKHVLKGVKSDRQYWDSIHRGFGSERAGNSAAFWQRMESAGTGLTRDQLKASIARLKDRALDREYVKALADENEGPTDAWGHWKGVMNQTPAEEHQRYARDQ